MVITSAFQADDAGSIPVGRFLIIFPSIGIEAYVFNTTADPLDDSDVRAALLGAISVTDLIEYSDDTGYSAALNFIPRAIAGTWCTGAAYFEYYYNQSSASGITEAISVELLHNESDSHSGRADIAVSALSSLADVSASRSSVVWDTYLQKSGGLSGSTRSG